MTNVSCLLCGSPSLRLLSDRLRHGPGNVWLCERCAIGMLEVEPEDLRVYYDKDYRELHGPKLGTRADYQEIFEAYVDYQGSRVELLRHWLTPETRLLEVGCSTGHFLYNVKDMVGEVVGVDYDHEAAAYAAEVCGCETFGCDLAEAELPHRSFDVVCAMQVMEHVGDPIAFARLLHEYVKPSGTVYVEVPNLRDALLAVYSEEAYRLFYFHEAHLFYFTASSLAAVMQQAGFRGEIRYFQDYNFLNHLHWLLRKQPQDSNRPGMGPPRLPVSGELGKAVRAYLEPWLEKVDHEYRELLAHHGATDNVAFIGAPQESGVSGLGLTASGRRNSEASARLAAPPR